MNRDRKETLLPEPFLHGAKPADFLCVHKLLTDLKSTKPLASLTLICYPRADPVIE